MNATTTSDTLISRAMSGDDFAFAELVDRHARQLQLFIKRHGSGVLRADFDADDVFQTVAFRAWERIGDFDPRGSGSFYRWLVRLARNLIGNRVHYQRAKGREMAAAGSGAGPSTVRRLADAAAASMTSIPSRAGNREQIAALDRAIDAMEPQRRRVLELSFLEGRSLREVADAVGLKRSTAWDLLQRALDELRRQLP